MHVARKHYSFKKKKGIPTSAVRYVIIYIMHNAIDLARSMDEMNYIIN